MSDPFRSHFHIEGCGGGSVNRIHTLLCPKCGNLQVVSHMAWGGLTCQFCNKTVEIKDWKVLKAKDRYKLIGPDAELHQVTVRWIKMQEKEEKRIKRLLARKKTKKTISR